MCRFKYLYILAVPILILGISENSRADPFNVTTEMDYPALNKLSYEFNLDWNLETGTKTSSFPNNTWRVIITIDEWVSGESWSLTWKVKHLVGPHPGEGEGPEYTRNVKFKIKIDNTFSVFEIIPGTSTSDWVDYTAINLEINDHHVPVPGGHIDMSRLKLVHKDNKFQILTHGRHVPEPSTLLLILVALPTLILARLKR